MNRTIKEATVEHFHYASQEQLLTHLAIAMAAYTFARRLKTLSISIPYAYVAKSGLQNRTGSSSIRSNRCRD